jgi:hypothetical protein
MQKQLSSWVCNKTSFSPRPSVDISEEGDCVLYGAQLYQQKKAPIIMLPVGRIDWDAAVDLQSRRIWRDSYPDSVYRQKRFYKNHYTQHL